MPELINPDGPNVPWRNVAGRGGHTLPDASWQINAARAVLTMEIDEQYLDDAIPLILGFARFDGTSNIMNRVTPMRHPRWDWLRAQAITAVHGLGDPDVDVDGIPVHQTYHLTVAFDSPQFEVLDDEETISESERYVVRTSKSVTQFITLDKGEFAFVDLPAVASFRAGPQLLVQRTLLVWDWLYTADDFAVDRFGRAPAIQAMVGMVNKYDYEDFDAGTLLMKDPEVTPIVFPCGPLVLDQDGEVPRGWNVRIMIEYFDPPVADDYAGDVRGHNLFPCRGKKAATADGGGIGWWPAKSVGSPDTGGDGGAYRYGQKAFNGEDGPPGIFDSYQ